MGKIVKKGINDLEALFPNIASHWDREKNGIQNPSDFLPGSNTVAWWKCDRGHSFKRQIYWMTHNPNKINCPICNNHILVQGVNDLATTHPQLIEEWDFEKNKIKPTEVHSGTDLKVWWKCSEYGHSWDALIYTRAIVGLGCPICSNQRLLTGFNDLATLFPEIKQYWDFEKNDKTPYEYIGTQSQKSVWFKCEKGHSWIAKIADFYNGNRCPYCSNKRIEIGFNDLATTHKDLVEEWDFDKNTISPHHVTYGSDKKVWWICKKGHSWKATINSRVNGNGCPQCSKEYQTSVAEKAISYYLSPYFDDLKENIHLKELGKRELDIFIPSLKLAVEYDGHNWHSNINNDLIKDNLCEENGITLIRVREEGNPVYNSKAHFIYASRNHGDVVLLKKPINELIAFINATYSKSIPLVEDIEKDLARINERFFTYSKANSLFEKNPDLVKEWNYSKNGLLKPDMVNVKSNKKVWWICEKGHEWIANVQSRDRGNGCPYCSNRYVLKGFNDLQSLFPQLKDEWDYGKNNELTPECVLASSNRRVWWKCANGHSWKTTISQRTRLGTGCPTCAGQRPEPGKNDLATLYPDLVNEWDFEKNGELKPSDVLPGSEKNVWWKCKKGHSYSAYPRVRAILHTGCPVCINKKILFGYNDLETLHPELAAEWNYDKNEGLLPSQVGGNGGSHKKVWWKCENGHEWQATLSSRIKLHTGCPHCYELRRKKQL